MKHSTLLLATALHTTATNAWTFTWRTSSGDATTESGTGPSTCISVNHAKGQIFAADGEGEENINMLLFSNEDCDGEPAGMATESFVKEASLDLKGFQVVDLDGGDGDGDEEGDEDDLDQTVTLPTVPATTTLPTTSTESEGDDDDQTFTLPTEPATSTNGTTSAEPTTTSDDNSTESPAPTETSSETESETDSGSEPSPTETDSGSGSETGSGEEDPAPTDAASSLGFSKSGIAGVVVCGLVGGLVVDALF
ncbi:hypothetical protein BDV19DRAFT_238296 [Aspergillus venezuelensis]